jgi:2,3-bisphosphoglycerate-independent phosphoglycerate mutase
VRIFFFFLDGIGLGENDPDRNPFLSIDLPALTSLTGGECWHKDLPRIDGARSIFVPTDACLGVTGMPQSATGQAAIMTGINVPLVIGEHYGPKPTAQIGTIIRRESVVKKLTARGINAGFLNAYPPGFFESIRSGKRLLSSNQLAMQVAGVEMRGVNALYSGRALSPDFTGENWRTHLGYSDTPLYEPYEAGKRLAELAAEHDFAFFDHWLTDYYGHRGSRKEIGERLRSLDHVIRGLLDNWDDETGLIVITSDHGNIEDLSVRGHTRNPVPTFVIGEGRHAFADGLFDLTDFAERIVNFYSA